MLARSAFLWGSSGAASITLVRARTNASALDRRCLRYWDRPGRGEGLSAGARRVYPLRRVPSDIVDASLQQLAPACEPQGGPYNARAEFGAPTPLSAVPRSRIAATSGA